MARHLIFRPQVVAILCLLNGGWLARAAAAQDDDATAAEADPAAAATQPTTADGDAASPSDQADDGPATVSTSARPPAAVQLPGSDLLLVPGAYYSQETELVFGVFLSWSFFPQPRRDNWPSTLSASASYSLAGQLVVSASPTLFLGNNAWRLIGSYEYRHYPDRFYGLGMDTPNVYQEYTESQGVFNTEVQYEVLPSFYAGLLWDAIIEGPIATGDVFDGSTGDSIDSDSLLEESIPGYDGGFSNGLGVSMLFDSRDSQNQTTRGSYLYASVVGYSRFWLSAYDFVALTIDLRQFVTVIPKWRHVIGLQIYNQTNWGTTPFYQQAAFGGSLRMRGWREGRFLDEGMLEAQLEYRFPIWWRFSGVGFVGVGEVYGVHPFDVELLTWSAGGGLRFLYGTSTVLRLDVAAGPNTWGLIINTDQAF